LKSLKILFTLFLLSSNFLSAYGQRTIKGRIIDGNLDILPAAVIYDADTLGLGNTDIDGYFELSIPKEANTLIFGFIGYEFATVSIPDTCEYLEIILLPYIRYHYKSNRKIDRLRKKEFDKLPEFHGKAVEKGLFTMNTPCFHREFHPIKPRLDKISEQLRAKRKAIKKDFKGLAIGDTIRIPFSGTFRHDGTDRTTLSVFSYVVDGNDFDCLIEGVIIDKNRRNRGYNIVYKVTDTSQCRYDSIVYESKGMLVGREIRHNMKYFKVITE
jgi:hypothetical protein